MWRLDPREHRSHVRVPSCQSHRAKIGAQSRSSRRDTPALELRSSLSASPSMPTSFCESATNCGMYVPTDRASALRIGFARSLQLALPATMIFDEPRKRQNSMPSGGSCLSKCRLSITALPAYDCKGELA